MKTFIEYDDVKPCPCGSQKTYNICCKLKSIRWGFDESGALVKQLPMSLETEEELKAADHLFEQYYGRKPDKEDYVFSFTPIYQDEFLLKTFTLIIKQMDYLHVVSTISSYLRKTKKII